MADSTFDPDAFVGGQTEGEMEVRYTPIPEGEYMAFIDNVAAREVNGTPVLDVTYALADEELKQTLGLEKPTVRQGIFCDVDENGKLAVGTNKNVKLGRLREAVKQNKSGKPWSPTMLEGAGPVLIQVTQRVDEHDDSIIYNGVSKVAAG